MRVIAIANQKGGVGKTTTSINVSASLSRLGFSVLLIDIDPQGNSTAGTGVDRNSLNVNSWHWLEDGAPLDEVKIRVNAEFDIVPSNSDLTAVEVALLSAKDRVSRLSNRLVSADSYKYIIIDCPPALNVLTINALMSATSILIPMQCEYFALEGLSSLLHTIDGIKTTGNPNLEIEGILRTMYDPRSVLTRDVSRQLLEHFGEVLFRTVIPRNIRLAEAPSHGLPGILYDQRSKGAIAYMALAGELIQKHKLNSQVNEEVR